MDKNLQEESVSEEQSIKSSSEEQSIKSSTKQAMKSIVLENTQLKNELTQKNSLIESMMYENLRWTQEIRKIKEEQVESIKSQEELFREQINRNNYYHLVLRKELKRNVEKNLSHHNEIINSLKEELKNNKIIEQQQNEQYQELNSIYQKVINECISIKTAYETLTKLHDILKTENENKDIRYANLKSWQLERENIDDNITNKFEKLQSEKNLIEIELKKFSNDVEIVKKLEGENELLKINNDELQKRILLLINDNNQKEDTINENKIINNDYKNKLDYANKYIEQLELIRTENETRINDYFAKTESMKREIVDMKCSLQHLTIESNFNTEEKATLNSELQRLQNELISNEKNTLQRISVALDRQFTEREQSIKDLESKLALQKEKYEEQLLDLKSTINRELSLKEQEIAGLVANLKSLTSSQYAIFQETEKIKLINDKMKLDQTKIDDKLSEIDIKHKREIEDVKTLFRREKDTLITNYEQLVKLQTDKNLIESAKVVKTVDLLENAKKAMMDITNDNKKLQLNRQEKETEISELHNIIGSIKEEKHLLQSKLDQALALQQDANNKIIPLQQALKTLQIKYQESQKK